MSTIRPHGGYRELRSFQTATTIHDATYWFCERFLDPRSRTCDQMVQAARSGRPNIAEALAVRAVGTQLSDRTDPIDRIPPCPPCGKPMVLRTAQEGARAG